MNLGMLDYIDASVTEVVQHTRTVNPDAGPLPAHVADVYDWCRQHTEHAPDIDQQRSRALEIRHRLEHAVRAGDARVVRPIRCPACGHRRPEMAAPPLARRLPQRPLRPRQRRHAPRMEAGQSSRTNKRPSKKVSGTVQPEPG
jgi:hypothetical protein